MHRANRNIIRSAATAMFATIFLAGFCAAGESGPASKDAKASPRAGAVDVIGTWDFNFVFPPNAPQDVVYVLNSDGSGENVTYSEVAVSWTFDGTTLKVTDGNPGGGTFVFTGIVTKNGTSIPNGTVSDSLATTQGTFTGTKQTAPPATTGKFAAVEKLRESFFKDTSTNVVTAGLIGTFKIVASVPIPKDFDFSILNGETVFSLYFAGFNGYSITLGDDPKFVKGTSTKVHVQQGSYSFNNHSYIPLSFDLDWSKRTTLKISISGNYAQLTFPTVESPNGFSIQALGYVDGATGKSTITGQDVKVDFGDLFTTLSVVSVVGVVTKPITKNGKVFQTSTIGVVSTTLKPHNTPAVRAGAAKP